jgi:hypothetical protein
VGISVFVFDATVVQEDYREWVTREIEATRKDSQGSPKSPRLRKWFEEMRVSFPLIGDAHPDDPYGTEYCFHRNVADVIFAGSVGEEGVLQSWILAEKHGVRLMVGDQLLPPTAPKGKRDFHISVLDGQTLEPSSTASHLCFVVFDPDISRVAPHQARTWVLRRLKAEASSKDQSILAADRLRQWADQFAARNLGGLVLELRFYREFIFIRVDRTNASAMISPTMELSHKLSLQFEVYVDPDAASS